MPWISAIVLSTVVITGGGGGVLAELSGDGAPVVKSALLTSVSAPETARLEEVALATPAALVPSKVLPLTPSRSTIPGLFVTLPTGGVRAAVPLASHTVKAEPPIAIVPVASGVGSAVGAAGAGGLLDEVVATGRDAAGQRRDGARRRCRSRSGTGPTCPGR